MSSVRPGEVVGRWRLVATSATGPAGEAQPAPYGAHPRGFVEFGADGRMMAVLSEGGTASEPERAREFVAYTGRYTLAGDRLVTRVDAASIPTWVGGEQSRAVAFDGDRLVLVNAVRDGAGGIVRRRLVWQRLDDGTDVGAATA